MSKCPPRLGFRYISEPDPEKGRPEGKRQKDKLFDI